MSFIREHEILHGYVILLRFFNDLIRFNGGMLFNVRIQFATPNKL